MRAEKKKVLVVATVQRMINTFLIPHIEQLEKMEFEVWMASAAESKSDINNSRKWVEISNIRNPFNILKVLKAFFELKSLLKKEKFEMIHCHSPVASFLVRIAGIFIGQKNVLYIVHGYHFYKGASLINWLIYYPAEYLAAKWTDVIITMNEEDYRASLKFNSKRAKIYNIDGIGIELEKYKNGNAKKIKTEFGIEKNEKIILNIAELSKRKNQIQLLKALKILKDDNINLRCFLVGNGNKKDFLIQEAIKIGLKNIEFLGYRNDIKDLIAASDVMVLTSIHEGLPRNIMEGMVQGKPFVVTDIRGNRNLVKEGINGYLVGVHDEKMTAEKIKNLLFDRDRCNEISKNNVEDVKKYDIRNILEVMDKIYKENLKL